MAQSDSKGLEVGSKLLHAPSIKSALSPGPLEVVKDGKQLFGAH